MERRILTHKDYKRLSKMIKGTEEDVKLTVGIINSCNIEKSFLYILALIPHKYIERMAFCSPLSSSKNIVNYLMLHHEIRVHYDLDGLITMWSDHCKRLSLGMPIFTKGQKLLAVEYIEPKRETFARMGKIYDDLNLKKNTKICQKK
jgi:hypothetical protein